MKSVRLTDDLRRRIVDIACVGVLEKEIADANDELRKVGMEAYESVITAEQRELMKQLGPQFIGTRTKIQFCNTGNVRSAITVDFYDALPVSYGVAAWNEAVEIGMVIFDKLAAAQEQVIRLKHERETIRDKVRKITLSAQTTKRLVEVWPEAAAYIPEDVAQPKQEFPIANKVTELNELLAKHRIVPQLPETKTVSGDEFSNAVAESISKEVEKVAV
jgi:hypothetical protein